MNRTSFLGLIASAILALLSGCSTAYDAQPVAYGVSTPTASVAVVGTDYVYPTGAIIVEPGYYYTDTYVDGYPYRNYYRFGGGRWNTVGHYARPNVRIGVGAAARGGHPYVNHGSMHGAPAGHAVGPAHVGGGNHGGGGSHGSGHAGGGGHGGGGRGGGHR